MNPHKGVTRPKYGVSDRQKMLDLYAQGVRSTRRIAMLVGCSHQTVWTFLGGLQRHYLIKPKINPRVSPFERMLKKWK